tara:strand:+ start:6504 stop:6719 length:216 start_codon:yes stop_codon:yes gene_type:complete
VQNLLVLIEEHLIAMQRDSHSPEFDSWKSEVDYLWKRVFENISLMDNKNQEKNLQNIKPAWMDYITHYQQP